MTLRDYYEAQYLEFDQRKAGWRAMGARHKARHIAEMLPNRAGSMIDVGGGTGDVIQVLFTEHGFPEMDLAELSRNAVEHARNKPGVRRAFAFDGEHIDVPDGTYDLALASHVVEHVDNPRAFLREMRRVAHSVFIEVPIDHRPRINAGALADYGHIHVFTPATIRFYIEQAGFMIVAERGYNMQRSMDLVRYGRFVLGEIPDTLPNRSRLVLDQLKGRLKWRFWPWAEPWSEWCILATRTEAPD